MDSIQLRIGGGEGRCWSRFHSWRGGVELICSQVCRVGARAHRELGWGGAVPVTAWHGHCAAPLSLHRATGRKGLGDYDMQDAVNSHYSCLDS